MAVHVDHPAPGMAFDPRSFAVRGWVWIEQQHSELSAIEVWSEDVLLGTAAEFHVRSDVNAKYALAADTRTGFELVAQHPSARGDQRFPLELRARLHDGTLTPPIFTSRVGPLPIEADPLNLLRGRLSPDALGLEIGAHTKPTPGLTPFYTDSVVAFVGTAGPVDFLSDARALPLPDDTLDYLCSSHVLEHLSDPIAALHEWHRVLRPGGYLYLVVPDKRFTFDEPRPLTSCEHLLRDFNEGCTAADVAAHVDEFVFQTNWSMLHPAVPTRELPAHQAAARAGYLQELARGAAIDIHFHTFTPASLDRALQATGLVGGETPRFTIIARAERYPPGRDDGIALLLCKTGEPIARRSLDTFRLSRTHTPEAGALPLVCPITLDPLQLETTSGGNRSLVGPGDARRRYRFASHRPSLLPAAGETPTRPWGNRSWRDRGTAAVLSGALPTENITRSHVDEPAAGTSVDPLCFFIRGWLWLGANQSTLASVEAWSGDQMIGETGGRYPRVDVIAAHALPPGSRTGFEIFAHHPAARFAAPMEIQIRARLIDGSRTTVSSTSVETIGRDYRTNHFGVLLDQRTSAIQRHDNIFAVGPSQAEGSGELAHLLRRYLGSPPKKIIDVGCGFGSYGRGLLADGYDWIGAEVNAADCAELARAGLPHRHVDGKTLPFPDRSFDAALCIEVLEHVAEPRPFLAEIKRVAPRQLIVSVPNCELLGYLYDHLATPWHMLEVTHTNFFTRWSLGALLREFYSHVELRFHTPYPLRTVEGTPLHYNLLAIATNDA